jgi:hypothetical protein
MRSMRTSDRAVPERRLWCCKSECLQGYEPAVLQVPPTKAATLTEELEPLTREKLEEILGFRARQIATLSTSDRRVVSECSTLSQVLSPVGQQDCSGARGVD